jgi:glycosyltransferase involved in cell wall biosynthesis
MSKPTTALVHYSAPPVIGGVEVVMEAHARTFVEAGYPATVVAGTGEEAALPRGVALIRVPEMDSQFEAVLEMGEALEQGAVPAAFEEMTGRLVELLGPRLQAFDHVIVHNVFTKHFNLPLTAALFRLLDTGHLRHCIAWCHDFTWTSPSSRSKVHPGYPWDLLRIYRPEVTYVVVSQRRQAALAGLFECDEEEIRIIYNGVDAAALFGLSAEGRALVERLDLLKQDLVILMPVRVTRAKNIEYALHVAAALRERGCRLKLILTGPPDPHDAESMAYFRELQDLRGRLGVAEEMRFVFESGPREGEPYTIDAEVVADLFRVSDVTFMPSHREGFGMPVLEAGLLGIPVLCTEVPAAEEIGRADVMVFDAGQDPGALADRILAWAEESQVQRLRRRVRQKYTWPEIFRRDIEPLLGADHG